jgi:hypothetical protein
MSDAKVDKARLPPDLWARRLWVPDAASSRGQPALVEVTDRKRLIVGALIMAAGFLVVVAVRAAQLHWAFAVSALILEVIGGLHLTGGRKSGFYVLAPDGGLGDYLGKNKPDLKKMRGTKV